MEVIDKEKERVKELTDLLNKYNYEYYVLSQPTVSHLPLPAYKLASWDSGRPQESQRRTVSGITAAYRTWIFRSSVQS